MFRNIFTSERLNVFLIVFVLALAAFLRLFNLSEFSFTADEVSAINRAQFGSFKKLIVHGVLTDTHPAGVQLFIFYWIKLFGISEFSVRLPFAIAGVFSVLMIYLIAKDWFNDTVAILAAVALATLEFPLTYSHLARPYSPGLLFCLGAVWYWSRFCFKEDKHNAAYAIGLVLCVTLAFYTHYIAAFFCSVVMLSGFMFVRAKLLQRYLLICLGIFVLYTPHLGIFFKQLSKGGIGGPDGWLGIPANDFLWQHLTFAFNGSTIVLFLFVAFFVAGLFNKKLQWTKYQWLCLIWFLIVYITCHLYSVFVNPILQNSILLFAFPCLILFALSNIREVRSKKLELTLVLVITSLLLYSTVIRNEHYDSLKFGEFKKLAQQFMAYDEQYGEEYVSKAINLVGPYSIHYYFSQYGKKPTFLSYMNNGNIELKNYASMLDTLTTPYFAFAWSTRYSPPEIPQMIQEYYPCLIQKTFYFNSEFYVFGKEKIDSCQKENVAKYQFDFETPHEKLSYSKDWLVDSVGRHGSAAVKLDSKVEFGPTFSAKANELFSSSSDVLHIKAWVKIVDPSDDGELVVAFNRGNNNYEWKSNRLSYFNVKVGEWKPVYLSVRLPNGIEKEDEVKIYLWNNLKRTIFTDDIEISIEEGNMLAYGIREDHLK